MPATSPQHSRALSEHPDKRKAAASVYWGREIPEAIRALGALANANYADVVTATIDDTQGRTPEQLIHAALDGLPHSLLVLVPFIQRVFLGLRLKLRPSPDHLLGWKVADRSDNWVRIEAASWFLTGHVVMHLDEKQVSFASFIRYDRWPAAVVWPPISLIHRQVALALVRSATSV
ncbi:MAG TPA: hypothetical protein VGF95_11590 [Solirubrobacteraceae bacterium]|jgi:hypothetical protein